mmetsp:Transcript_55080/g.98112  ORF Transcript_55080/g.98112 Transcript_55080/m.98112 type:complete len:82 (+) Transcript_55080:2-247(+)
MSKNLAEKLVSNQPVGTPMAFGITTVCAAILTLSFAVRTNHKWRSHEAEWDKNRAIAMRQQFQEFYEQHYGPYPGAPPKAE